MQLWMVVIVQKASPFFGTVLFELGLHLFEVCFLNDAWHTLALLTTSVVIVNIFISEDLLL